MSETVGPDVLDASALLALLQDEPGARHVQLAGAVMSAVNYAEVVQKSLEKGARTDGLFVDLELLGLEVIAFDAEHAEIAAKMHSATRSFGLTIADRACLALAQARSGTAVTADQAWRHLGPDVRVRLIR